MLKTGTVTEPERTALGALAAVTEGSYEGGMAAPARALASLRDLLETQLFGDVNDVFIERGSDSLGSAPDETAKVIHMKRALG